MKKVIHKRRAGNTKIVLTLGKVPQDELLLLSSKVKYVPSQKHKRYPIPGQQPYFDHNSAKCPNEIQMEHAQKWLKEGISKGAIGPFRGDFPSVVWFKHENTVYEAKLTHPTTGEYHGFPLEKYEWPNGIEKYFE